MAQNKIEDLTPLAKLKTLETLHLRENNISSLFKKFPSWAVILIFFEVLLIANFGSSISMFDNLEFFSFVTFLFKDICFEITIIVKIEYIKVIVCT